MNSHEEERPQWSALQGVRHFDLMGDLRTTQRYMCDMFTLYDLNHVQARKHSATQFQEEGFRHLLEVVNLFYLYLI